MEQLETLNRKIYQRKEFFRQLSFYRFKEFKIVFTNGCFDILHRGHIEYLAKTADFGDKLVIGLNTDESVKRLKGDERPLNDQYTRALNLAALRFVSNVIFFEEDTPLELIRYIEPDVLVKGSDYKADQIVGSEIVLKNGGRVETIDFVEGYSSTILINKIKSLKN